MEIARVYFDVSMSYSFDGLKNILKESKVKIETLPANKFIIFINSKQTAFKMLVGQSFIVYHNNGGRKFPLEAIQNFPEFFDGKKLDFSKAVEKAVLKKVAVKVD